ncbi:hypothetical protein EV424DRAFT_469489 [Suillus variegatus]|nr:hypothetical protein EV424DRAFT_469489 [Suillus variegatus]
MRVQCALCLNFAANVATFGVCRKICARRRLFRTSTCLMLPHSHQTWQTIIDLCVKFSGQALLVCHRNQKERFSYFNDPPDTVFLALENIMLLLFPVFLCAWTHHNDKLLSFTLNLSAAWTSTRYSNSTQNCIDTSTGCIRPTHDSAITGVHKCVESSDYQSFELGPDDGR